MTSMYDGQLQILCHRQILFIQLYSADNFL